MPGCFHHSGKAEQRLVAHTRAGRTARSVPQSWLGSVLCITPRPRLGLSEWLILGVLFCRERAASVPHLLALCLAFSLANACCLFLFLVGLSGWMDGTMDKRMDGRKDG